MKTTLYLLTVLLGLSSNRAVAQWEAQTHPFDADFISCLDATHCYACGGFSQGNVIKTIDGTTWQDATGDLVASSSLNEIICFDNNTCLVNDNTLGDLYKTTNGGTNWQLLYTGIGAINFINSNIGFSITYSNQKLAKTIDGGQTWNELTSSPPNVGKPFFLTESFGYALASDGASIGNRIYRTVDGGNSWQLVSDDTGAVGYYLNSMKIVNANVAFAVGSMGTILRTTDGGDSWARLNNPFIDVNGFNVVDFIDANNGYVVGGGSHIIKTTDGGEAWIDESYTFNLAFDGVQIADMNTVYVSGTNYILKNDSAFASIHDLNNLAIGKIYPNPATDIFNLELNITDFDKLELQLFDVTGKKVKTQKIIQQTTTLERGTLQNGFYQFQILKNRKVISNGKIEFN